MSRVPVVRPLLPALLAAAGLSACGSNPSQGERAPAPDPVVPAVVQVESAPAPASPTSQQPRKARKGAKPAKGDQPVQLVEAEKPAPAVQPAPPTPAPSGKIGPGMNSKGEVVDSTKVEAGYGQQIKGLRDWEGEITGRPASGSKFTRLQIGMPLRQVTDLVGQPSDQGAYITGKAFIPFFFGSDTHRQELVYKNQGRLIFAGGSMGDFGSAHLVWIIHNANEPAYR